MSRRLTLGSTLVKGVVTGLVLQLLLVSALQPRASFGQSISQSTWIRNVPDNVAFYSTMNHLGEQVRALMRSKALANLVQLAGDAAGQIDLANADLVDLLLLIEDDDIEEFRQWVAEPENRQLMDVLQDMLAHEVFLVGGTGWAQLAGAYADFTSAMYREMARSIRAGEGADEPDLQRMISPQTLKKLEVPTTLLGFKVADCAAAQAQFARLKLLLPALAAEEPQVAELIHVKQIAGSEWITLEANGAQIPWDQIPENDENEKVIATLRPVLEQKTIAVSLGLKDDYLLLSVGKSNEHLQQLGQAPSLLERPELARLREHTDQKIVSAGYVSEEVAREAYNVERYFDDLASLLAAFVNSDELELDDMLRQQIQRDIDRLADDLGSLVPRPGAMIAFSYLTPEGYEGFTQSWAENLFVDGSQQLPLVKHLGGDPLIAAVTRARYKPELYTGLVKWLKKIDEYVNQIALEELGESERREYELVREAINPSLRRMDQAMSQMIIPAMRDGQSAFVLDAKLSSKQWHVMLPASEQPLTIIEPALVYGVSDAGELKEGVSELFAAINEGIERMRRAMPDQVPPFVIPPPQSRDTAHGDVFFYPLLGALGGDARIAPAAALGEHVAALTISAEHAERLLSPTEPSLSEFFRRYADRPLAAASFCNWSELVDVIVPWVEYGMSQQLAGDVDMDPLTVYQAITATSDFLRCFRSLSSVTFLDGDSMVSHYQCQIEDVGQ